MNTRFKLTSYVTFSGLNFNMSSLTKNNYVYRQYNENSFHSVEDSYRKAVKALNCLQSNKQVLANPESRQYAESKRIKVVDFFFKCGLDITNTEKKLSLIHVSGTKGKGSTCAYCESILKQYGYKTGFYSSPHLVSVRETIRINGQPISRQKFSDYFWEIYRKLCAHDNYKNVPEMPPYFTFLTIMAFKVFLEEKVDVAIIEVGIGGEYDCTNILQNTAVVGITSLGYDHVKLLGNTIEEIAWQKAGIMKPNCIAITVHDQPSAAMKILREKAEKRKCTLFVAPSLEKYFKTNDIRLGIYSPAQFLNASLGVQLANAWLNPQYYSKVHLVHHAPNFPLSKEFRSGLQNCHWPGRTQIFSYLNKLVFYLDGAHNIESIQNCVQWFRGCVPNRSKKVLVFNMTGNRDGHGLMECLTRCQFEHTYFCPNLISLEENSFLEFVNSNQEDQEEEYKQSERYYLQWLQITKQDKMDVKLFANVNEIFKHLENNVEDEQLHVLVTGSLHLVGAFLSVLNPELN